MIFSRKNFSQICCTKIAKKRLIGFTFGAFLSYLCFFVMITQMDISLNRATFFSSIISLFLCFGLAYSKKVQYVQRCGLKIIQNSYVNLMHWHNFRCVVLLLLPQLCSKQGRSTLVAYIFLITFSGPAANIIENIGVLTASLSCGEVLRL